MADINYGYGTGLNDNQTSSGYAYTVYAAAATPETFDGAGIVNVIKIYNNTANGRLRIWKGTFTNTTFVFDDYTEIVDIVVASTGWITLTAPTDFTAFSVTANTGLLFYSNSSTASGLIYGRGLAAPQYYGYNSADPPYSGNLSMSQGTSGRLEIKIEGSFPNPQIDNIEDEDFFIGETNILVQGQRFNTTPGTIAIANGTIWASADKETLVWDTWTDTYINITEMDIGTLTPGTLWVFVADYEGKVSPAYEVFTWIRPTITAMGAGDELFIDGETGIDILGTDFGLEIGSATVRLGDASVYENCGTLDPQIVTYWSDTLITFTATRTSLDVEDCWVFVVQKDGHPSNGWPVTMLRKDAFQMSPSGNLVDKETTSPQLSSPGGAFTTGQALDISNPGGPVDLPKSRYTEFEWCLKALTDAINGAQYEFRATDDGVTFYIYSKIAKVTLA